VKKTSEFADLRRVISLVLDEAVRLYRACSAEREKMHELEAAEMASTSALMEMEDITRIVRGVASSFRPEGPGTREEPEEDLAILEDTALCRNEVLMTWLMGEAAPFPGVREYLLATECLRLLTREAVHAVVA